MLKGMRKNTKIIIWIVVLSFALWGGFSVGVQFKKEGRVAGEVFGKDVTFQEFNRFYKSQLIFSMTGENAKDPETVKQQAWQSLIYSREAKRLKIEVSDADVRAEVIRLLAQQKMENVSVEIYREWLRRNIQETPEEFESKIRELLRVQRLVEKVKSEQKAEPMTEEEALERFKLEESRLSGEVIRFKTEAEAKDFAASVKSDEDWKKKAEEQKLTSENTGMITLLAWFEVWGFNENDMNVLLNAEPKSVHGAMALKDGFAAVKVLDKQITPEEEFQKTFKEKYMQQTSGRKSYEQFLVWHQDLLKRAGFKDYMPGSKSPNTPEPAAAA